MKKPVLFVLLVLSMACGGRGPAVWNHSYLAPLDRGEMAPAEAKAALSLRATPGEYEPAVFAVRQETASRLEVNLVEGTGLNLPTDWCRLYHAEARTDSTPLNRLIPVEGPVETPGGVAEYFWLDVHPPSDADPGTYTGRIEVQAGSGVSGVDVSLEVLPFKLEDSRVTDGAFMWLVDLPPGWYDDMKAHGLDAIQYFTFEWEQVDHEQDRSGWSWDPSTIKILNRGGNLELDFSALDRVMEGINGAGMNGPVVISLGNDHFLHYECSLARAFGIKIDTSAVKDGKPVIAPEVSPKLDELFMRGLELLRGHWDAMKWRQELVILIYDEPTERLLSRCKNRYDLLKKVMPETRVYGVVMNRREWAESMLDQCDVLVANGDFEAIRDLARENGKDYWVYSFPLRAVHTSRWDMGYLPWRVGASGAFFWMYNYWFYDPDNCAVYPQPEDPMRVAPSPAWEGIREGADDLRYLATLEKLIDTSAPERAAPFLERLEKIRASIDPSRRKPALTGEAQDETSVLAHYAEPQKIREKVIEMILELGK